MVENLSVAGMMTRGGAYKRGLNHSIARAALARTRSDAEYKTAREGGTLIMVDRFYPSSKTCSTCGHVKTKLTLAERTYHCDNPSCRTSLDRDLNAAINLARQGLAGSTPATGRGATQKTASLRAPAAAGDEASTAPSGVPAGNDGVRTE